MFTKREINKVLASGKYPRSLFSDERWDYIVTKQFIDKVFCNSYLKRFTILIDEKKFVPRGHFPHPLVPKSIPERRKWFKQHNVEVINLVIANGNIDTLLIRNYTTWSA